MPLLFPAVPNDFFRILRRACLAVILTLGCAAPLHAQEGEFDCVIDPSATVKLGSPVSGVLSRVLVDRGDVVRKGQPIAELESQVEIAAVNLSRARVESTARVDAQAARLALAEARLARSTELVKRNIGTQDQFDQLNADMQVARQDLLLEQQARQLAQFDLEQAEATLRQRTILSPIDAIVTERPSSAGEFITQDGYVAALAQLDPLHVEVYLPIVTYGQISVGSIATIYPEPPISGQYSAKAIAVDSVFDPASGTYGVRLELENPDSHLPAGQRCRLSLAPR